MIDFIRAKFSLLNTPQWRHLYYLLYWIIYLFMFQMIEHLDFGNYHILHCRLDDYIPFCEYFVVPYLFWFVYMGSMVLYTMLRDRDAFVYFMRMIIITSIAACAVYCIYPNGLMLRPGSFERNNVFTKITSMIYAFDTSTNVCPSLHVCGSVVTLLTWRKCRGLGGIGHCIYHITAAALICMSTVFMKQHSVIDVFWGLVLAGAADAAVNCRAIVSRFEMRISMLRNLHNN